MHRKHLGALSELQACSWLLRQGYEVFRNVSQAGIIDIVAFKDGIYRKFDVKTASGDHKNKRLSDEQISHKVELLHVLADGTCEIDSSGGRKVFGTASCRGCGGSFQQKSPSHIFCGSLCRLALHRAEYLSKRLPEINTAGVPD